MISAELLALLRCPLTLQTLHIADAAEMAKLPSGLDAALIREDGTVAYPVRDSIPLLLPEEAITLPISSTR